MIPKQNKHTMEGPLTKSLFVCLIIFACTISAKEYSVEMILEQAYENSPTLKKIEMEKEITKSMRKEYFGKGLPVIEGNLNVQHQPKQYYPFDMNFGDLSQLGNPNLDYMNPGFSNDTVILNYLGNILAPLSSIDMSPKKNTIAMDLSLTQPIFAQGKVMTGLKIAKSYLSSLELKYKEAKQNLSRDIRIGFNAALLANENYLIQSEAVELAKNSHRLTKIKFESGKGILLDTLNSQYELQQSMLAKRKALKDRDLAIKNLFTVANIVKSSEDTELLGSLKETPFSLSHDEAKSLMLERNRSLEQLKKAEELQKMQTSLVRSDYFPAVYCGGSLGKITQWNKDDDITWYSDHKIFVGTKFEIFSGGQRIQKIKQAKDKEAQLQETKTDVENMLLLALSSFFEELEVSRTELNQAKDLKELTEKALKISQLAYETGQITHQELRDSEQKMNLSKLAYNAALFKINSAITNINLLIADPSLTTGN